MILLCSQRLKKGVLARGVPTLVQARMSPYSIASHGWPLRGVDFKVVYVADGSFSHIRRGRLNDRDVTKGNRHGPTQMFPM